MPGLRVIQRITAAQAIARLASFGDIVDVRSPGEFSEDRLPGALNWPVLDDEERRLIGTEYKQVSPFEARKRGAALVAQNIAAHIARDVMDKPKSWQPLVYCWRGGQRSGSMGWFLDQMGFRTHVIEGGYQAFRHAVMEALQTLPPTLRFTIICGRTGSGKTRLLQALREAGAQVLDLEALACHRGSVLGSVPGKAQPGQKAFETLLWDALRAFDPARAVFVESESKRIGKLRVPEGLVGRMRLHGDCVHLQMPDAGRLALLLEDYAFLAQDAALFGGLLDGLVSFRGKAVVERWKAQASSGQAAQVFLELMQQHYDPGYLKSMRAQFAGFEGARVVEAVDGGADEMRRVALQLMQAR